MAKKKSFWKRLGDAVFAFGPVQWLIASIIAVLVWFVYFTCRKKYTNLETFMQYRRKPAIFVFWHGRSMMLSPIVCLRGMRSYAVASRHKDGRLMAKLQHLFGLRSIYGSSSDGGLSVLLSGVRALRTGDHSMCISPDGPGGPSLRVQSGALYFAKMTGAPIIPVCFSSSKAWIQKRWDKYLVALPFSTITCNVGNPIFIDSKISDNDFEIARKDLENYMVQQMRKMDAEFNLPVVEQDLTAGEYKKQLRAEREAKKAARHSK